MPSVYDYIMCVLPDVLTLIHLCKSEENLHEIYNLADQTIITWVEHRNCLSFGVKTQTIAWSIASVVFL